MTTKTLRFAGMLLLAALPALAQPSPEISVAWAYSDDGQAVGKLPKTFWTSDDAILLLDERVPAGERSLERIKAPTGERRAAFDRAAARQSLAGLLEASEIPEALPWPESFDRAGQLRRLRPLGRRLPSRPRLQPLRSPDPHAREGVRGAPVARRPQGRVRPGQRPLGLRPRLEEGGSPDLRRERDGAERGALVGVLGGGLQPRGGRLLVVGRLAGDRVPSDRRAGRGRGGLPEDFAGRSRSRDAALSEGGRQEPGGAARHRRSLNRKDGVDERGRVRVHPRTCSGSPTVAPFWSRRPTVPRRAWTCGGSIATGAGRRSFCPTRTRPGSTRRRSRFSTAAGIFSSPPSATAIRISTATTPMAGSSTP